MVNIRDFIKNGLEMWTKWHFFRPHSNPLIRHFYQFVYYFSAQKSSREIHPESPETLDFTDFFD